MYVDISYTCLMYTPRRMEELFSDARPVWPFYRDVKLISDWEREVWREQELAEREEVMEVN